VIELRRITPDDWRLFRELRLAALAEAPYAYGSTLAQWSGENDLESRWRARLSGVPCNLIAYLDGGAAGLIGATGSNDGTVQSISLWVAPFARGKGIADALIRAVCEHARTIGARSVCSCVRETNVAARAAYERNGFIDDGNATEKDGPPERRMMLKFAD
jgi:RimJ/RimL family protein N-acetyltransferase